VRFLFGLPFALAMWAVAAAITPGARPNFSADYWLAASTGAFSQLVASAALLVAMRRAGFAVGTAVQQSSLPLAALIGLVVYHDRLSALGWSGVGLTTLGLVAISWPKQAAGPRPVSGAAFGALSGLLFGFSLSLDAGHPIFAALVSVAVVQAVQSLVLGGWLALRDPATVRAVAASWRRSLGAGLCGACASAGWFTALALAPAAAVRSVGVIEAPMAAFAGRRFFRERLHLGQLVAGCAVLAGVVLTTLG
jgi:drug/metabolite transporter (DMT)-like permease